MHQTLFYYENIMGFIFSSNNIQGYSLSLRVLLLFIRMRYEVCSLISQCKSKPPQISTLYSKNCNLQPPDPAMISNHFSSVGFLTKLYYNKNSPRLVSSTMTHIYFYFSKKEAARRNWFSIFINFRPSPTFVTVRKAKVQLRNFFVWIVNQIEM